MITACNDKMIKGEKEIVTTPNLCTEPNPESEPSPIQFAGVQSITDVTQTSVKLNWVHVQDLKFYHVLSYSSTGRKIITTVNAPNNTAVIKNLTPDTVYRFLVRAIDEQGYLETNANIFTVRTAPWPNYINQKSISFNGNQSINIGASSNFKKGNNLSFSLWFKPDLQNVESEVRLINFHKGANAASALSVGIDKTKLTLTYTDSSNQVRVFTKDINFDDNSWHHIALTANKNSLKLYVNGTSIAFIRVQLSSFGTHAAHLGAYTGNQKGYVGLMDEVLISNAYLSPNNISDFYASRANQDPRDLISSQKIISWYRMGDSGNDGPQNLDDIIGPNNGAPLNMNSSNYVFSTPQ